MKNVRFMLKKIALVVLCALVLTFAVSCDNENPPVNNDGDPPSSESGDLPGNMGDYGSINNDEWDENK